MTNDWFLRTVVEPITKMVAAIIFNKPVEIDVVVFDEDGDVGEEELLLHALKNLVYDGCLNEAENLLFEKIGETKSERYLKTALDFYGKLNSMNDAKLASCNFTREEVRDGFLQVLAIYEIDPNDYRPEGTEPIV